ncbi:MAG: SMP-30/gluconolactonase/LRE family protein [Acidobacteriota bacterium]
MRTLALILLASTGVAQVPTYYARNVAGVTSIGDGGPATAARVLLPARITRDSANNIYIAESLRRIRRVALDGSISTIASQQNGIASGDDGPAASAGISSLFGITVAGNFLYIAQRVPCNIRRVNLTTGIISNFAGTGTCAAGPDGSAATTTLDFPGAITADPQGRIYITESFTVRRIDPLTGQITRFAGDGTLGSSGDGGLATQAKVWGPLGLAIDSQGTVYISDTANCKIRRVVASTNIITTVAGTGSCAISGDGGPATAAQLQSVSEIALDATGSQLYMAGSGTTIRRVLLSNGTIERFAGTGTQGGALQENVQALQADLRTILGVHVDAGGNVLFADFSANRVGKIAPTGILTTFAGGSPFGGDGGPAQAALLSLPLDVIPEPGGGLLIAESINRRIRRVSPAGVITTIAGIGLPGFGTGNGGPAVSANIAPLALARDKAGNIYATDGLSGTVRRIAPDGTITQVGPALDTVAGLALDPTEQFLYVSQSTLNKIAMINLANGTATVFAGAGGLTSTAAAGFAGDGGPASAAQFSSPIRVATDSDGNVYVADSGNNRIRRVTPNGGRVDTVAGNGQNDASGDGNLAVQASLPGPTGVVIDSAGNIIIGNNTAVFRVDKATGRMNRIGGKTTRGSGPLGPALATNFNVVNNVAVDSRGVIYFAEPFSLRVVALTPSTLATPAISGIITPGNFGAGTILSPGGWMEIYGEKLASVTREWAGSDFAGNVAPTSLGGVKVRVQGKDAFVQLISTGQINAVAPDGIVAGNVTVEVINSNGTSDSVAMVAGARGPYLLAPPAFSGGGKQYLVGVLPDGAFVGPAGLISGVNFRAVKAGDRVVAYGVGFGGVAPTVAAGNIATSATALPNARVKIGGKDAVTEYAGLAGGFVGLYQFNIVVPSGVTGDARIEFTVDGVPSPQLLYLTVQ